MQGEPPQARHLSHLRIRRVEHIRAGAQLRPLWIAMGACLVLAALMSPVARSALPFGPNLQLSDGSSLSNEHKAALAADETGNVYAAWGQNRNGDTDLYFAKSADGGRSWGPAKRIAGNPPASSTQDRPSMTLGPNGEIVVVWQDDRLTYFDFDIWASVSFDGGGNFALPLRVSDAPAGSLQMAPTVAVGATGLVSVAWQDYRAGKGEIWSSSASLPEFLFGPNVRADDDPGSWTATAPSAAVTSTGTIYIAYHDNRSGSADVYLTKSSDGGRSFGPGVRVDDTGSSTTAQGLVSIAADGLGRVYAVWQDSRAGEVESDGRPIFDIYFARSTDGGLTFSKNVRVDDGPRKSSQEAPRVTLGAAGTIYVAWDDARNTDWDPYFSLSTNGGTSFGSSIRLDDAGDSTTDPPVQYDPQIAESRTGLVFAAWEDARGATSDIYGASAYFAVGSALRVTLSLDAQTGWPGERVPFTVRLTDNGTPVDDASLSFSSTGSGSFDPVQGAGGGSYRGAFTSSASTVNGTDLVLTATATKPGYVSGSRQGLLQIRKTLAVSVNPTWDLLAVGQSMPVRVGVKGHGNPVPGATVSASASGGSSMSPPSGTTDAAGNWSTSFTPSSVLGGTDATISVSAAQPGFVPGTATVTVPILAQPRMMSVQLTSPTRELMSREHAEFRIDVAGGGLGVTHALLSPLCLRGGNFSAVSEGAAGAYYLSWQAPDVSAQTWVSIVVRVQRGGYMDASARVQMLVDPNMSRPTDPTQLFLIAYPASNVVHGGHTILVTVFLYTLQGYVVSGASLAVLVAGGLGTATKPLDGLNGKYTFLYTAPSVGSNVGVLLRIDATKSGYAPGSVRITLMLVP